MVGSSVVDLTRQVLLDVAEGREVPWGVVDELVEAVLDDEVVRLALAVAEGGEHAVSRAVQLAGVIAARSAGSGEEPGDDAAGSGDGVAGAGGS